MSLPRIFPASVFLPKIFLPSTLPTARPHVFKRAAGASAEQQASAQVRERGRKIEGRKNPSHNRCPVYHRSFQHPFSYPKFSYLQYSPPLVHTPSSTPPEHPRSSRPQRRSEREVGKLRLGRIPATTVAPFITNLSSIRFPIQNFPTFNTPHRSSTRLQARQRSIRGAASLSARPRER
ncbi:hypothetical protein Enr13x_72490 [Stieleria neptunia]|uniref:Uncharacterized protein n=1 Tax=Stieleria neptunia TaxID=2527979 RepID=A0A518I2K3_9BACT|nr:hypothetical protein Enr13x_72490 [Stieleria neptunia]